MKRFAPFAFVAVIIISACGSETKTNSKEETEITTMDSSSKALKERTEKLEEQTKKVEASLEKLDDEFKTNN